MDVTALVIAIIGATTGVAGVVTAVISISIARRSATAGDITAIATKTATEVAQKQLAIERDRHRYELEQRDEDAAPALAGHVVKNDGNDGDGHARLEIRVTNSVRLTTVTLILPPSAPVSLHGRTSMMEQRGQFPEAGSGQIEVGRPARWDVDLVGEISAIRGPGYSPYRLRDEVGPASSQRRLRRLTGRPADQRFGSPEVLSRPRRGRR